MNGATAELCVKINNRPNNINMVIIGIIHHSFLCQRKTNSSLKIPNLDKTFLTDLIFTSFFKRIKMICRTIIFCNILNFKLTGLFFEFR